MVTTFHQFCFKYKTFKEVRI